MKLPNRMFTSMLSICAVLLAIAPVVQAATIAHWDFNSTNAVDGAFMPGNGERQDLDGDGAMDSDDFRISALDLSGNGNHLTAWTSSWMKWSRDSVQGDFSMMHNNSWPASGTDSAYNPFVSGADAESITPAQWTVEAVFKSANLAPYCTILGRDGYQVGGSTSRAAALYLSTRRTDLAIDFTDVNGVDHNLQVPANLKAGVWYSVAAVSDGTTLSLYLNGEVIGTMDLTSTSTDTSLGLGYGTWSVARGMWNNGHVDRFYGVIDEVAISDAALDPSSFVIPVPAACVDTDHDGMSDLYENFFHLNPTNSVDAPENFDADTLINFAESILSTDPHAADTDTDGLNDDEDQDPLSRAVMLWGHPGFTTGDAYSYTGPDWWLGAGKLGGVWTNGSGWTVPAYDHGSLYMDVDRTRIADNLVLNILHQDVADCHVYLDLGGTNGMYAATNLYGNLTVGSGAQMLGRYILPLADYPEASRIYIDAMAGSAPYTVFLCSLYVDADADGLDLSQEVQFGTLDTNPDTDADNLTDYIETMIEGTDPLKADTDGDGIPDGQELLDLGSSPLVPMWQEGGLSGVLQVERWNGISGELVSDLARSSRFGNPPDQITYASSSEYADRATLNSGDNYGIRMRGTITAPVSGSYTFYLTGDNTAQVWLSRNDSPYDRQLFLDLQDWTEFRNIQDKDTPSATIELTSNQVCYVEVLLKEGAYADHVSLLWTMPGASEPEVIDSDYLHSYVQPADDQDADGMSDTLETACGLDPFDGTGGGYRDNDGDAYNDLQECRLGTDVNVVDEDGDGLKGGDEASITLTDPYSIDTDADGTNDLTQIQYINGADATYISQDGSIASWSIVSNTVVLSGLHFVDSDNTYVSYEIDNAVAGMHQIALHVRWDDGLPAPGARTRMAFFVDGIRISINEVVPGDNGNGIYSFITPWLTAGRHVVKCQVVPLEYNTPGYAIVGLDIGAVDGADTDDNGFQDWMESILSKGGDTDSDGLTDLEEVVSAGTDPLNADTDRDGLGDEGELAAGTDPRCADTDGDGISDGEEVLHAFTDPLVADFGESSSLLEVNGAAYISSVCSWEVDGSSVYARDRNGMLEYSLLVASNGNYVLEIEVAEHNETIPESSFDLSIALDDVLIDRATIVVEQGVAGRLKVWLPEMEAGNHAVQLKWNNIYAGSSLQVNSMRLLTFSGPDLDNNGQVDWLDNRLANLVGELIQMQSSPVSPVCLEGTSQNHALVEVTPDFIPADGHAQMPVVKQGLGSGWYADTMLSPYAETAIDVVAAPGAETQEASVDWFETNLMTVPSNSVVSVRLNDALLLSAIPEGAKQGSMIISVEGPACSTNLVTLTEKPVPYVFDEPGTYVINGFYSKSRAVHFDETDPVNIYGFASGYAANGVYNSGNTQTNASPLVVEVVDAGFGSDPYAVEGISRTWTCPNMPTNLVVESDPDVTLSGVPLGDTGTEFSVLLTGGQEKTVLARLCEGGPVVDRASVHAFTYDSGGYYQTVTTFTDGSSLIMFTLILSEVPDDLVIQMNVATTGTTFDDGSLSKTLTADDFDDQGVATYYVIRSDFTDAACHTVAITQGDDLIDWY